MKKTDYAPRAADFDTHLKMEGMIGIEIGVDVGAHAEAMLMYCTNIIKLYLVDPWHREYYRGYCEGRLHAKGLMNKVEMLQFDSISAYDFIKNTKPMLRFDFMYFDQLHDYTSVKNDLENWWPLLNTGGLLGYRNYAESNVELKKAVDEFIMATRCKYKVERGEIVLFK